MSRATIESPDAADAHLRVSLLVRIDLLLAQISARDGRIDELLARVKTLTARRAEVEAKLGMPAKTPDNSSLPPSTAPKANVDASTAKSRRRGHAGVARVLCENPNETRRFFATRCTCGTALDANTRALARAYDHTDLPVIEPITTRVELFRATCPCCRARVTADAPADMPDGTPFGPEITARIAYLHWPSRWSAASA